MRIVIYTGYHNPAWNPPLVDSTGLGGTEQCVLNLAKQFATEHEVYVVGDVIEGDYDNVFYRTTQNALEQIGVKFVDCVIGVSYINYLLELESLNFNHSIFWPHNSDFFYWHQGQTLPNKGRDLFKHPKMTGIVCLTNWHKERFIEQFPESLGKIKVIGNGVDVDSFVGSTDKISDSFIYTSHAERGLSHVLDKWSDIKKLKPNATLHIATPEYGYEYFMENFNSLIADYDSVKFHGSLPVKKLYQLMSRCEYWYYPTNYEETFCITALEMLGHRVKPIATKLAGLNETLGAFNLVTLDNIENEVDFVSAKSYLNKSAWPSIKNKWNKYIFNMDNVNPTNQNTDILDIECVYVISLNTKSNLLDGWKSEIRTKLLPWYVGPIVCKRGVNGIDITENWLSENGYGVYTDWKLDGHKNTFWSEDLTPGEIGCAISHHRVWAHAYKNKFKNILILEEDFSTISSVSEDILRKVPGDYDLFYLGRNPLYRWWDSEHEDLPVGDGVIVKPAPSFNAHAYMLSRKGIKSVMDQNFDKYLFPVDDFFIACSIGHARKDLGFIENDLVSYALADDLVSQNRPSEKSGPRINEDHRKHSDLYSYWDDPEEWQKKFIAYSARTKEWQLIMDEPFTNCFSMPLFTPLFCKKIREEAEYANAWTTDRHEFYPTTDMLLEELGMTEIYYEVLKEYAMPAAKFAFQLDGDGWDEMSTESFLAKYVPDAQGHLSLHHDSSDITALLTLSNFDEYDGGGTYFSHQKKLIKEKQGHVSIHPGNITHKHGARATTAGTRYIIVSFMKNLAK
jgi:glycosyltransferase involved in cell wall biosynthesis|tara:strand:+ start:568 stop:2946 length:2379 start_codon:yes stop_codon:yes gene_type:complete